MTNVLLPSLTNLLAQAPVLIVYVVGLILALVFWRRHPMPSLLTLVATTLLLLTSVTQPFLTHYLMQAKDEMGWTNEKLGWMFGVVGLANSCLRAAALGLLLAAVFLGRKVTTTSGAAPS